MGGTYTLAGIPRQQGLGVVLLELLVSPAVAPPVAVAPKPQRGPIATPITVVSGKDLLKRQVLPYAAVEAAGMVVALEILAAAVLVT